MSQPPEYPGNPADPQGGYPPGYPPQPRQGGGYGAPPPPPPSFSPPPSGPDFSKPQSPSPGSYQAPGYSAPPPPPPPGGGYGAPPPGPGAGPAAGPFSVGDAFSWAWGKFTKNVGPMAGSAAIFFVVIAVLGGIMYGAFIASLMSAGTTTYDPQTGSYSTYASDSALGMGSIIGMGLMGLVLAVVGYYMQAAMASGSLDVADGRPVSLGSFLKPRNLGPAVLTALLVALGVAVGTFLCYIPGLIFAFLSMFAIQFAIDRSLSPVDSIKASINTTKANVGPALLSWLVQVAVLIVGEFACGVGLIAAIPVAMLIQVYTYRKLTGGHVAPLEQAGQASGLPPGQQYPGQQYPGQQPYPGQQQYPGQQPYPGQQQYPGQQY